MWEWWQAVLLTRLELSIIDLPAIADSEDDALGRKIGEPLWPARYGRKSMAAKGEVTEASAAVPGYEMLASV
ncbi:hypothetical protein [Streptomyces sp. TLI_171]|uniref:hypothetical protein n=1 Tax=Streptomyces sp. TLI_171 TaxID=1938859 RepID=UPI00117F05E7|nr:hypothetical protein [Streptomyces sp. TLI_171]